MVKGGIRINSVLDNDKILQAITELLSGHPTEHKGVGQSGQHLKCFLTYLHHPAKDRGVVHCAAVPSPMPKLVLAFFDACLRTFPNVLHVILIQVAEFLLSLRKSRQLAAERLCTYDIYLRHLNRVIHT